MLNVLLAIICVCLYAQVQLNESATGVLIASGSLVPFSSFADRLIE